MTALVVALAAAVALLTVAVVGLLRSHAEILRALHELGAGLELDRTGEARPFATATGVTPPPAAASGRPAPAVAGTTLDGETFALAVAGRSRDTVLAFLSSGCATCGAYWTALRRGADVPGEADLVVVTRDLDEESESALRALDPGRVPVVLSTAAWDGYAVPGSPYVVYVDGPSGTVVGEGSAATWEQVADLLRQARADHVPRDRQPTGGNGRARDLRDSDALAAAGITPGHPSLYAAASDDGPAGR